MKRKFCSLIVIMSLLAISLAWAGNILIVPGTGIGKLKLQSKFTEIEKTLGAPAQILPSKKPNTNFCVYKKAGLGFLVEGGIVQGITVYSPKYKLENGIGVGYPQIEVIKTYRQEKITQKPGGVIYPEVGVGFSFEAGAVSLIYIIEAAKSN
jgi:hypothetical protein